MKVSSEIISFIRELREEHPWIGKDKIKPLPDEYCKRRGISSISICKIGKIIKRYVERKVTKAV